MKKQFPEEVITSGGEPSFANKSTSGETFLVVMQKIDDDICKFCGHIRRRCGHWGV